MEDAAKAEAVEWIQTLAESGDAKAQKALGICYFYGKGIEKDTEKAFQWFEKAAEQEDAESQFALGNCYYFGEGVEKDTKKAIEWCQKAALQGNIHAQYNLGLFYGSGLAADMNQAVKWIRKAAEQGHVDAQYFLAKYFMNNAVGTEEENQAIEWYHKAVEQGHMIAKKELGAYYYNMAKKCKAVYKDESRAFYKKLVIVLGIAMILLSFEKMLTIIVEFACFVAALLINRARFKKTESYWVMVDYLHKAAELGHKAAKRELRFWR